jgi:hypothetical protein
VCINLVRAVISRYFRRRAPSASAPNGCVHRAAVWTRYSIKPRFGGYGATIVRRIFNSLEPRLHGVLTRQALSFYAFHSSLTIRLRSVLRPRTRRSVTTSEQSLSFDMINCLHCFRERSLFGNGGVCLELHSHRFAIGRAFDFLSIVSCLPSSNRAAADSSDAPK